MIEFRRGDSFFFKFFRRDTSNEKIIQKTEKIWFTVKDNANSKKKLIQKTLDNGITFTEKDGYYHVEIEPQDTKSMMFKKKYYYDIQVENAGVVTTIKLDILRLKEEITDEGGKN